MKKSAKITYTILRILMAVVFIISAVGFFLNPDASVKSTYLFNCGQSALFLIISFTPVFLKKMDLDIPDFIYIIFILFCLAHFLCGEILGFFATVSWWDSALHTFSGMLITLLAFSVITLLNKGNGDEFKLSLTFTCLFATCITISVGVLWEIVELVADSLFGLNMQRAYESTISGERGVALIGQEALMDTMKDLILDALGAVVVCIVCSIFVIKKGLSIQNLILIKKKSKNRKKNEVQQPSIEEELCSETNEAKSTPETSIKSD